MVRSVPASVTICNRRRSSSDHRLVTKCNRLLWDHLGMPAPPPTSIPVPIPERLSADERREALLDVARTLVNEVGPGGITMGVVAERARVTRALVYKHFANKHDLLVALYRREATGIDRAIR